MEDKILEKAGEMFLNLGFKSVTMDDIANELGMSKKTLYKYFSNKASLVSAATSAIHSKIEEMIASIKDENYNSIEEEFAIKAVFQEMLKSAKESPMYQLKKYYPDTYSSLMEKEECLFRDCNYENLEKGISQGFYRESIDKEKVMTFYFILTFGIYDTSLLKGSMQEVLAMEYDVLQYHIRAIATDKGLEELDKQLKIINQTTNQNK